MIRDAALTEVNNLRGGRGTVKIYHVLTPEELYGHGRLYRKRARKPLALPMEMNGLN